MNEINEKTVQEDLNGDGFSSYLSLNMTNWTLFESTYLVKSSGHFN